MILRKPYAAFIKYFKIMHIVISLFATLLLYRSYVLFDFFRTYSIDYRAALGDFTVDKYLNGLSFVFIVVVIIINVLLLSVMLYKKKPKLLYVFNLILFIYLFVVYMLCSSALGDVSSVILDIKYSKALRDLSLIGVIAQAISLLLISIRALGFDIKRFDFGTDLQKLDISDKDSEEIEVALNYDKDETIRNVKYRFRNIKYAYLEHKFIVNSVVIAIIVAISVFSFFKISSYTERYKEGETFSVGNYTMNVLDSFVLNSDSNGRELVITDGEDAGAIVAIRFQVKSYSNKVTFNTGLTNLRISGLSYAQDVDIAKQLSDIAEGYAGQELSDEFETYLIAFEVSDYQSRKAMTLKINDSTSFVDGEIGAKNVLVKLNPTDLRKENSNVFNKKIGETISFDDSILGSSSLTINSIDINNKFKLDYEYCYGEGKCFTSFEYVTPTASGNYFKTLMRVNGNMSVDRNVNTSVYDLRSFLNLFGTITYKINDDYISKQIDSENVKPNVSKTDDIFIEIPYEVKDASEIYLSFKIRNQNYKYALK